MKCVRLFIFALFFAPSALFAANDFQLAAQLLSAAKNADIQQVQGLVNNGANVNYTDATGLSIVCTALMNNDVRAAQILQMYGADASRCDQQIKKYNQKKPQEAGGLFSGLSTTQSMTLAAAGAAVVVGGLFLLTDVFGSSNGNKAGGGSASQCTPNESCTCGSRATGVCNSNGKCDCSGSSGGGTSTAAFTLAYGPALPNAASETASYAGNLDFYSPTTDGTIKDNFAKMNANGQNYLLMMHGYSPLARGYMGMRTLRMLASHDPIPLTGINLGTSEVLGGRPVNVALVTANGINAAPKPAGKISETGSSLDDSLLPWTTTSSGTSAGGSSNDMISSQYYNNTIDRGSDNNSILDDSTREDNTTLGTFDLSNSGTAIGNVFSSDTDQLLAKIVGGNTSGYTNGDFVGFMPNGQMTIFRTGGGQGMAAADNSVAGSYADQGDSKVGTGDTLNLFGSALILTMDATGNGFTATDSGTNTYKGYIGADGLIYIDSDGNGSADKAYAIETNNNLTYSKELVAVDYLNYKALLNAGALWIAGDSSSNNGRSRPEIIANASVIAPLRGLDVENIDYILSKQDATDRKAAFYALVNKYYNRNTTDGSGATDDLPGTDAISFFSNLGSGFSPLVIFSTGSFETDNLYSGNALGATFENSAPLVFDNLEHLFMSVVAVGLTGTGTAGAGSVSGYNPTGKITLSQWQDQNGTPSDTDDDKYYKARICGIGGNGTSSIDPWCFAAAGVTDELAAASMAGAVGSIKSAFDYLNNKQLFALLALTADGPYLATNSDGKAMTTSELRSYLEAKYQLPTEYQFRIDQTGEDYFKVFKEVFGYGLVNLERATKPASKIYYYNGTDIVSGNGNAYWRAASRTQFSPSSAINVRGASVSAPFYDILQSADGSMSLPRVWENEFALGSKSSRALYMGDVLGEFAVDKANAETMEIGALNLRMSFSEKAYADSMGGLDNLQFGYSVGNVELNAEYQRRFTDGISRFIGTANPILSMASNTVSSAAKYKTGGWSFGMRAFSGAITDESLLENDPTISSQHEPARLGLIQGAQSGIAWENSRFGINASFGAARESDTVLGIYADGLLSMGQGDTTYIDTVATYSPAEDVKFSLRSTFARTKANASGEFILGLSNLESNAFSAGADIGNFSFAVSRPLAVTRGNMQYAHAEYEVVENDDGGFDLVVKDTGIRDIDLAPENREMRFSGAYRTRLGPHTSGAFGFIYRVNPNNTKDFGNESILMVKFSHKLGI
jgi:hypothetical protein